MEQEVPQAEIPAAAEEGQERAEAGLAAAAAERRLRRIYGAIGLTALLCFASFHPIDLGILAWVAIVPMLYVAATEGRRVAIVVAYCATVLYHVVGLSWIAATSL